MVYFCSFIWAQASNADRFQYVEMFSVQLLSEVLQLLVVTTEVLHQTTGGSSHRVASIIVNWCYFV